MKEKNPLIHPYPFILLPCEHYAILKSKYKLVNFVSPKNKSMPTHLWGLFKDVGCVGEIGRQTARRGGQ